MPYKYIGRTTDFKGKTLWEILGNLKNFGVGRLYRRSRLERYSDPSFCKILKVEPLPCPEVPTLDNRRKVKVLVEKTFRGVTFPNPVQVRSTSYKADYQLIPKDEEHYYYNSIKSGQEKILPRTMDFPPILKEVILREKEAKGEDVREDLQLEMVYKTRYDGRYRIAEVGEEPTVARFSVNMDVLPDVSMYKNIKMPTK